MLCTAWPLAPLVILSKALITMSLPVRESKRHAISMTFEAVTFFVSGSAFPSRIRNERLPAIRIAITAPNSFLKIRRSLAGAGRFGRSQIKRRQNPAINRN